MDYFGYLVGIILGLAISGAVLGLIPFITGLVKKNKTDGIDGFKSCIISSIIIGLIIEYIIGSTNTGFWSAILVLALAIYKAYDMISLRTA